MKSQFEYKPVFTLSFYNRTLQLTREGTGFIILIFGIGIGAINTGNNLLYLILAMCCSFIAVSGTLSELTLRDIRVEGKIAHTIYSETSTPLNIKLINKKKKFPSFSLNLSLPYDPHNPYQAKDRIYVFQIPPQDVAEKHLMISADRRGWINIRSCNLSTSFPFGFFVKTKKVPLKIKTLVFPPIRKVSLPAADSTYTHGTDPLKSGHDELVSLREFRSGDPLKSVHWKSTAKTGELRIKEFSGLHAPSFSYHLNLTDSQSNQMLKGDALEQKVSEAASTVFHLIRRGDDVQLKSHDWESGFGNSESHLESILKYLALVGKSAS